MVLSMTPQELHIIQRVHPCRIYTGDNTYGKKKGDPPPRKMQFREACGKYKNGKMYHVVAQAALPATWCTCVLSKLNFPRSVPTYPLTVAAVLIMLPA
jgi:hypothetical protein